MDQGEVSCFIAAQPDVYRLPFNIIYCFVGLDELSMPAVIRKTSSLT